MTLEDLKTLSYACIPGANKNNVSATILTLVLNKACDDIAAYTCCISADETFHVVEDLGEYSIQEELTNFLTMDKSGLWWNDGTQWKQLNPRTLAWLDRNRPNWRDLGSGDPEDYVVTGNKIFIIPAPDTTLADGFKAYIIRAANYMSKKTEYPFTGLDYEYIHLRIFSDAIIKYARWQIEPMINKKADSTLAKKEYQQAREEAYSLYRRRRDISASKYTKFTGKRIV